MTTPQRTPVASPVHPITEPVAGRLAFIRLLYNEGERQCKAPEPLNAQGVLTLHDASELLLGLAADTIGASLPKNIEFMAYWPQLDPAKLPGGVKLPARQRMQRVNNARNDLKHHGIRPSLATVQTVQADVAVFIEDTVPLLFGVSLASVDMADVVADPSTRNCLKSATTFAAAGDLTEAMADLSEAFDGLFRPYASSHYGWAYGYGFGRTMQRDAFGPGMNSAMSAVGRAIRSNSTADLGRAGKKVDDQLNQLNDVVGALQRGMRVLAVGIDYAQYNRFVQLVPNVYRTADGRKISTDQDYAPTREEYESCYAFVVSVALRVAQVELDTTPPSWRQGRQGGSL